MEGWGHEAGSLQRTDPGMCHREVRPHLIGDAGPQWDVSPGPGLGGTPAAVTRWTGSWLPPEPVLPRPPSLHSSPVPNSSTFSRPDLSAWASRCLELSVCPHVRGAHPLSSSRSLLKGSLQESPQQPTRPAEQLGPPAPVCHRAFWMLGTMFLFASAYIPGVWELGQQSQPAWVHGPAPSFPGSLTCEVEAALLSRGSSPGLKAIVVHKALTSDWAREKGHVNWKGQPSLRCRDSHRGPGLSSIHC